MRLVDEWEVKAHDYRQESEGWRDLFVDASADRGTIRAERDRARDLAAHLEAEMARLQAMLDEWSGGRA